MDDFFLIVGVGRSGTSLLQSILSSHSKVCIPSETGFLRTVVLKFNQYDQFSYKKALALNDKIKRINSDFFENSFLNLDSELHFYIQFLEKYRQEKDKPIVGDKDPRLVEFLESVINLFPSVKIIHLFRDPRDILLSKKKADWSRGRHSLFHIFANYVQLKIGELAGKKQSDRFYETVGYERILNNPEDTLKEICVFLDIEYEHSMLEFQEKAKELVSEEELQWKKKTTGPLLKNNFGKWKGNLLPWEVVLTEKMCDQAFSLGNYECSNVAQNMNFLVRWLIFGAAIFLKGAGNLYISYRLIYQKILLRWKY